MKRNIIFLSILTLLTLSVMVTEFFYTKYLKEEAESLLEKCITHQNYEEFYSNINKAEKLISNRKYINNLFHPKDILQKILVYIKRADTFFTRGETAQALAEVENAKALVKGLG